MLVNESGGIARPRGDGGALYPLRAVAGRAGSVPPSSLLLIGMITVQVGSALAKELFSTLGPAGVVFLRVGFAALVLLALWRPWRLALPARGGGVGATARVGMPTGARRADYVAVVSFGLVLALMNFMFYLALTRIPLGVTVMVEFVGPLGVAIAGSRRARDLLWAALALGGIVLLAPLKTLGAAPLDPLGLLLALGAGACWATYILLSARVGRVFPGGTGLSLAMVVGALALVPVGVIGAGSTLLDLHLVALGLGVALLSSVVPYSLEMAALRRMPPSAFGVLMSLEPAIAALIGWLVLHEQLEPRALVALALVTAAAIGATRASASPR
ncbi:MAG TPA: EamA family transporter [Ktedonobacterales bacterium]|nr:EamA family transporter [Ktedonobacterales bacterium]